MLLNQKFGEYTFITIHSFPQLTIVNRSSKESRQMALESIKRRAEQTQEGLFPQTIIFPEGTCTNAKALIKFKVGAFHAGNIMESSEKSTFVCLFILHKVQNRLESHLSRSAKKIKKIELFKQLLSTCYGRATEQ